MSWNPNKFCLRISLHPTNALSYVLSKNGLPRLNKLIHGIDWSEAHTLIFSKGLKYIFASAERSLRGGFVKYRSVIKPTFFAAN